MARGSAPAVSQIQRVKVSEETITAHLIDGRVISATRGSRLSGTSLDRRAQGQSFKIPLDTEFFRHLRSEANRLM